MKKRLPFILYLLLYMLINLSFLTVYPFVHSDESWISGLTRNIFETGSIYSTESFFTLFPRYPHMIKIIYQFIQIPFILTFGYHIFSVRLISLIFSMLTLYFIYLIVNHFLNSEKQSLFITILFSLNIQYLYASHFARQEIAILFIMLGAFYYYIKQTYFGRKQSIILGSIIGISIGIHPNSFILALIFGCLYILDVLWKRKTIRDLLTLVFTVSFYALFFVSLSLLGNPEFFTHYYEYGSTLGVNQSIALKFFTLGDFYHKLYYGISGTYYTPCISIYLITFMVILFIAILLLIYKYKKGTWESSHDNLLKCILSIFVIHIGIIFIGRYNPTSVIFIFPFFYMLFALLLYEFLPHYKKLMTCLLSILILLTIPASLKEILPYTNYDYSEYLEQIGTYVPKDIPTLGNLNAEFYFENGKLFDYRNLTFLDKYNMSFKDFIKDNSIEYIIYHEELDYIHRNQNWNILYGEDDYYEDMNHFLATSCTLVGEFENPLYAIRITKYMMDYPWKVWIYRINK